MTDKSILLSADPRVLEKLQRHWRDVPARVVDPVPADRLNELNIQEHDADGRAGPVPAEIQDLLAQAQTVQAALLIEAYRARGHLIARIDPLGLSDTGYHPDLDPATYTAVSGPASPDDRGPSSSTNGRGTALDRLLARLRTAYCGTLAVEFAHLDDRGARSWIAARMETPVERPDPTRRRWILDQLIHGERFEHFLQTKFPGIKRFGLEGAEAQLPLMERVLECASEHGVRDIVIGPMHRGRTTFMATVMGKPLPAVLAEFTGRSPFPAELDIPADASFHIGYSGQRNVNVAPLRLSMPSHPSHVETVVPVALGKVRAKRDRLAATDLGQVLGVMMHTDAGFAAQGIAAETHQLANLPGYSTGGSIHIVINNQVGFTTSANDARSSRYCSDPAKAIQAPVFHVNGDDPEAVVQAAEIAFDYWARFGRDVVIDLVCYRRRGHNELDEPRFTQPQMYSRIDAMASVREAYARLLAEDGVVDADGAAALAADHQARFEAGYAAYETHRPGTADWLQGHWAGLRAMAAEDIEARAETGVAETVLREVGAALAKVPDGFSLHPKLRAQLGERAQSVESGLGITWPTAEALAIGSLLREGRPVRLTGQDTCRGTFSQRHAVLCDQATGAPYTSLNHVSSGQAALTIHDSPLSEAAALAFEYGYSLEDPKTMVLWEAQFGDFANAAQVLIDQYLASGEEKWLRQSGLTLLLPHGLEGGGPEHSSARVERFLQLCAANNLQIVNCTTPANYFHALRRQLHRDFRKPLVLLTPKGLLRHKRAVSSLAEMSEGTHFRPVIEDERLPGETGVRRILLMSGRLYYDLLEARADGAGSDIAFIRIEQLYPLPQRALAAALARHPEAELVWCQEEPENMGAWRHMRPLVEELEALNARAGGGNARSVRYVGRPASASPATGLPARHAAEQARLVAEALA